MSHSEGVNCSLQLVKLSEDTKYRLHKYALERSTHMNVICDEAVNSFLDFRKSRSSHDYKVLQHKSKPFSAWIDDGLLERVKMLAEHDGVTDHHVLYAALVRFVATQI